MLLLSLAVSCASPRTEPSTAERAAAYRRLQPAAIQGRVVPALRASELARVPAATFGPYLGLRPDGALVIWAAREGSERKFSVVPLSPAGRPLSLPLRLETAPADLGLVAVRPLGTGFVVAYTSKGEKGEALQALCLDARGQRSGSAVTLGTLPGAALWVEVVATSQGGLVFTATRNSETPPRAELAVVALDPRCAAGERRQLAADALAWQATALGDGALLALVRGPARSLGSVDAVLVAASGVARTPLVVNPAKGAELDLDATTVGKHAVLAWTDASGIDARVLSAAVDASGKLLAAPAPLTAPEGEQSLVRLVPPAQGAEHAFVAWETLGSGAPGRRIRLSALTDRGRLSGPSASLDYASNDGGAPELASVGDGIAALTLSPACKKNEPCTLSAVVPTFVRLGRDLTPTAVEPLRLEPLGGKAAELGFGLGCTQQGCFSIAAQNRIPAPVFATELVRRSATFRAPVTLADTSSTPRVLEHQALVELESVAAFSVDGSHPDTTVASLTDYDPTTPWRRLDKPAADGRYEPLRARLELMRAPADNAAPAPLSGSPVSLRAHSAGRVAVASGPTSGQRLVAWAGVDQGQPQVFVTLIGKRGEKLNQRMLTRKKGNVGDVALAWVGDGWIVAWVDERSGDPEVYASKVSAALTRSSPEQRLTNAVGVASDLALAFDGKAARLVWSDARSSELSRHADIFSVVVGPRDALPQAPEVRLATTRAHSFSPAIQAFQTGFAVAWVEAGETGGSPGAVVFTTLASDGGPAPLLSVPGAEEPRSVGLWCEGESCRFAAILERNGATELGVASWSGTQLTPWKSLLSLAGNAAASVPPRVQGDTLFFADSGANGVRVRRARVAW